MKVIHSICWVLTVFAAFNCGIIGLFDFDLVRLITADSDYIRLIYILFGVAAVWYLYGDFNDKE